MANVVLPAPAGKRGPKAPSGGRRAPIPSARKVSVLLAETPAFAGVTALGGPS
jgi:hypothetical protein